MKLIAADGDGRMMGTGTLAKKEASAYAVEAVVDDALGGLAQSVPEEDKAEECEAPGEFQKMREKGFFSPVRGMANIQNVLGGKIYAQLYEDSRGMRFVEYCQKYGDGTFSPKMRLPQADMRIAERFGFVSKDIPEAKVRNRVASFIIKALDEYEGTFRGEEEELLEVVDILNVLVRAMKSLPVHAEEPEEMEPEEFYRSVVHHIEERPSLWQKEHKSYYVLDEDGLGSVAKLMRMKPRELLRKLDKHGFIYRAKSSKGYQTNVRFRMEDGTSFTDWMYCIYRLQYFVEEAPGDGS